MSAPPVTPSNPNCRGANFSHIEFPNNTFGRVYYTDGSWTDYNRAAEGVEQLRRYYRRCGEEAIKRYLGMPYNKNYLED